MAQFSKKPVVIDAIQWWRDGNHSAVQQYNTALGVERTDTCGFCNVIMHKLHGWVITPEGGRSVCPGDWIITGVKGEHYSCKPYIFKDTYEAVAGRQPKSEGERGT